MAREHQTAVILVALSVMSAPIDAQAERAPRLILKAGLLADTLRDLSARTTTAVMFTPDVVGGLRNPSIVTTGGVEAALNRVLEGTGLTYQRAPTGVIIVVRGQAEQPTALPELLVVGKKTQNADIRRTQNDIQAYSVATAEDIRSSHADDLDDFLRFRQTDNATRQGPSQEPAGQFGSNRSEVNLHGLGADQTLVLVDGVRMPSVPSLLSIPTVYQPDLNGLPLMAIDRIESLTGTAGGIYGSGATGGVINVVLKRDYQGAEISATRGVTGRGDAARRRVDAQLGFTPDHGRTDIMVNLSHTVIDGLRAGDRTYGSRARSLLIARDPAAYARTNPTIDGVLIQSLDGSALSFKPALGGGGLGSNITFLPTTWDGSLVGSLRDGANQIPNTLSPDGQGALRSLTSDVALTSVLLNVRRRLGDRVEIFADLISLSNTARSVYSSGASAARVGPLNSVTYPFTQGTTVTFPLVGFDTVTRNRLLTQRWSAGALVDLPGAWRAEAHYSQGRVRNRITRNGFALNRNFDTALSQGRAGAGEEPTPDPFGPWGAFTAALQAYKIPSGVSIDRTNRFRSGGFRLAGPLLEGPAGPTTLSLLTERREEDVDLPAWRNVGSSGLAGAITFSQAVWSVSGELRAKLVSRDARFAPARGLELQLATRYDEIRSTFPTYSVGPERTNAQQTAITYTAGLRAFPFDRVMVRASVATGVLPPTPVKMQGAKFTTQFPVNFGPAFADPARGGQTIGSEKPITLLSRGSSRVRAERAQTLAFGVVFNPEGRGGPRIALDVTHIEKRGEISLIYATNYQYFLAREALYPDRVVRDPLSDADAARGFTAGVVTLLDVSALNIGKTTLDAIDLRVDHTVRLGQIDRFRVNTSATWTPRFERQAGPDQPRLDHVSTLEGPLRWRATAGVDWDHGDLSIGLNGQYYGGYQAINAVTSSAERRVAVQPGIDIPARFYLDAQAVYHLASGPWPGLGRQTEIRVGVENVFDRDLPIETRSELGYSYYGDPRGRRVSLTVTARF